MQFERVEARAIKDSRGSDTIEVGVNGCFASSPAGKSTGKHETKMYYKDLETCIKFLQGWHEKVNVKNFGDLEKVENIIKKKLGIKDAREFGGNALYAFESAVLKALAKSLKKELWQVVNSRARKFPRPAGNAVGGGLHSAKFKEHPVYQEYLLIPNEKTFADNVKVMSDIYNRIGKILKSTEVNDEGAWHAKMHDEAVLENIEKITSSIEVGIDLASSSFFKEDLYDYNIAEYTKEAHIEHLIALTKRYNISYLEDALNEEDFEGFAELKKLVPGAIIVGDDLTVTHLDRVKKAVSARAISGVIIKPNQTGSMLEVRNIIEFCKKKKIRTIFSHRSGETLDDGLADYAFGFQTDFIKCGIATKWRKAKLDRMIEIEKNL